MAPPARYRDPNFQQAVYDLYTATDDSGEPRYTTAEIAERLHASKQTVHKTLQELVRNDWPLELRRQRRRLPGPSALSDDLEVRVKQLQAEIDQLRKEQSDALKLIAQLQAAMLDHQAHRHSQSPQGDR